jgi:hypothetical protein
LTSGIEEAAAFGRSVLHLIKLDATTVLDWLRDAGERVDRGTRTKEAVDAFSGEMAIDEVYDGGWYQLKATDPLNAESVNDFETLTFNIYAPST